MIYFIEIWNAKPAWLALSTEERGAYMAQIGPHIQGLLDQGVEILTWSENDTDTTQRAAFEYFAIWSFPSAEMAQSFEQLVAGAGWYNYFEQHNLNGQAATVQDVISTLVQL